MRVICYHKCLVLLCKRHYAVKRRNCAVHAEDAVCDDKAAVPSLDGGKFFLKISHINMAVHDGFRF
ncbi:Uncharacterised protein [Mycobacteroides abscessus subsp. massiliense]|nr:Uncharacterised protein [Mycobacteroides abscessus subsp. massiliense]